MHTQNLSRRKFLKVSSLAGTALCVGYYLPLSAREVEILNAGLDVQEVELNAWITIDTAGKVTIFSHRAEMGQGVFQSIPQIVAEELEVLL